ncbi:hypothetical protein FG386_001261 [Cryptosporidium ryanae]|uniref:uncharacterized protein n=1 Tax=Cryptosporidium ryanae TaxID=515981 RepID=UPI00351A557E|nr:hypothetical protein FG386_001261 [Cryptosporidium ryanae]
MNSGYYEKVLLLIGEIESNNADKNVDLDTLLDLTKLRCKLKLNQLEIENIESIYHEYIENQKYGNAAICLYAIFCVPETSYERKEEIVKELKQIYIKNNNELLIIEIILVLMYILLEDYSSAISISDSNPNLKIIQVFIYCTIDRFDLAEEVFEDIMENYDAYFGDVESLYSFSDFKESSIVRIASAWLQLLKGEYNSSLITYANLQTDFGENSNIKLPNNSKENQSVIILNGISVIHMQRKHFNDAYELLQKAYMIDPRSQVTLSNLITCSYFMNFKEPEKYINELKSVNKNHCKISSIDSIEKAFKNI